MIFAVSILSFEQVLASFPTERLSGILVVDVLSVKLHAKKVCHTSLQISFFPSSFVIQTLVVGKKIISSSIVL